MNKLIGERIVLKKASLKDANKIKKLITKDVAKYIYGMNWPFTLKNSKFWLSKLSVKNALLFLILKKEKNQIVGAIWLENINLKNRSAEVGFLLSEKYQGKGYGYEAGKLLLRFAFRRLKLKKITALTTNHNKSSMNLLEKLGFKIKKKMKRDYFDKNLKKWCDVIYYENENPRNSSRR